ncbi:hypothetical protein IG631_15372 [Alternaria alternata]|nr:hypothetical protein IG631_15372 [Alternaria alternata]
MYVTIVGLGDCLYSCLSQYAMVWEAFYACASADALMNKKLPKDVRREYEHVYNLHDSRARQLIIQAIDQFAEKSARGDYTDVLPLYYATFLLHASGVSPEIRAPVRKRLLIIEQACTKGSGDLKAAMKVFSFFNGYTALFPLRIKVIGLSDNNWTVRMLVSVCMLILSKANTKHVAACKRCQRSWHGNPSLLLHPRSSEALVRRGRRTVLVSLNMGGIGKRYSSWARFAHG